MIGLLLMGAGLASAGYLGLVAVEALRPPRRTAGWAIAHGMPVAPDALGLEAEEWWVERDRVRLPVWDIRLRPDGPTVVLLHGWGRSRLDSLGRIGPFLGAAGRIVLPDLRGHGEASGRTRLGDEREEADLDELLARLGPEPIVLAGHSMGATLAIRVAARHARNRVPGVVALAPYDTVRTPLGCRLRARELPAGPFVPATLAVLRAGGISFPSTRAAAERLGRPLLVLAGDRDRVVPWEESRRIAEAAGGEFVAVPGAEHSDLDRGEEAGRAIEGFVARAVAGVG